MRCSSFIAIGAAPLLLPLALLQLVAPCHGAVQARDPAALDPAGGHVFFQPYPGLTPRYVLDGMPPIARRDDANCNPGYHSCLDINSTLCCPNDRYCMIDPATFGATCCSIGLTCSSPCNETQYECNATTTKAVTQTHTELISGTATLTLTSPTTTPTGAGVTLKTVTATITTTSIYLACCARHCPATSQFLCASTFGGGCCQYGQTCASSHQCIWTSAKPTAAAPTTTAASGTALVSALPSDCTTSQISCASSLGGGCCAVGHTCTVVSDQVFCAQATGVTGATTVDSSGGGGLSAGAKAGIAIGVIFGAGALVGAATWLCIRRRRRLSSAGGSSRRASALPPPSFTTHDYDDLQQGPRNDPPLHQPSLLGGAAPASAAASSPVARSWRNPSFFLRRNTGTSSPATPGMPTASERGGTQDYFGPVAVPGPLTEPVSALSPLGGPGAGVPVQPHDPRDIVAPVEIDSSQRRIADLPGAASSHDPNDEKYALGQSQSQSPSQHGQGPPPSELPQTQQHFELYGSEVPATPGAETAPAAAEVPAAAETEAETSCDSPTVPRTPQPLASKPAEAKPAEPAEPGEPGEPGEHS